MSLSDKLKKKIGAMPKLREVTFMGEVCATPRMSKNERDAFTAEYALPETGNERMAEMICALLLDPKTGDPIFEPEYALNEMPDDLALEIVRTVFGGGVERAEKN